MSKPKMKIHNIDSPIHGTNPLEYRHINPIYKYNYFFKINKNFINNILNARNLF